jgi:hypothetical protein
MTSSPSRAARVQSLGFPMGFSRLPSSPTSNCCINMALKVDGDNADVDSVESDSSIDDETQSRGDVLLACLAPVLWHCLSPRAWP